LPWPHAAQVLADDAPTLLLIVPAGQASQPLLPPDALNLPAGHAVHALSGVSSQLLKRPELHCAHEGALRCPQQNTSPCSPMKVFVPQATTPTVPPQLLVACWRG
jgi:hypothetical protein